MPSDGSYRRRENTLSERNHVTAGYFLHLVIRPAKEALKIKAMTAKIMPGTT